MKSCALLLLAVNAPISVHGYSSCRDVKASNSSAVTGWYAVTINSSPRNVYCDMTTDGAAAYTIFPTTSGSDLSVNLIDNAGPNGCTDVNMTMIIPRTKDHWDSMFTFVTNVLNYSASLYFQTVPGIYKSVSGATPCNGGLVNGIMNSGSCSGQSVFLYTLSCTPLMPLTQHHWWCDPDLVV